MSLTSKKVILVVEDEIMLLDLLKNFLEDLGLQVLTAENGQKAFEILQQRTDIGIVLTDLQMPQLSGTQLREKVENLPPEHQPKSWIALTACTDFSNHKKNLSNFEETLYKPYRSKMLRILLKSKFPELFDEQNLAA